MATVGKTKLESGWLAARSTEVEVTGLQLTTTTPPSGPSAPWMEAAVPGTYVSSPLSFSISRGYSSNRIEMYIACVMGCFFYKLYITVAMCFGYFSNEDFRNRMGVLPAGQIFPTGKLFE
ncbi:Mannosylglycoprotein endo-beta-mannosidase [Dendrobium catenatum]|uniref:Mannosylglycoprotein endo-beta-mannosidase n=1 Tax=Dendrobium catenatum TaxID=906689 RepID=A0A2I0W7T5_9ASPA|nr:Mannosylglycoprotein endo-beta-mannosidase [Dendrobium catenatum]